MKIKSQFFRLVSPADSQPAHANSGLGCFARSRRVGNSRRNFSPKKWLKSLPGRLTGSGFGNNSHNPRTCGIRTLLKAVLGFGIDRDSFPRNTGSRIPVCRPLCRLLLTGRQQEFWTELLRLYCIRLGLALYRRSFQ